MLPLNVCLDISTKIYNKILECSCRSTVERLGKHSWILKKTLYSLSAALVIDGDSPEWHWNIRELNWFKVIFVHIHSGRTMEWFKYHDPHNGIKQDIFY